jgi:hypothetical protein
MFAMKISRKGYYTIGYLFVMLSSTREDEKWRILHNELSTYGTNMAGLVENWQGVQGCTNSISSRSSRGCGRVLRVTPLSGLHER